MKKRNLRWDNPKGRLRAMELVRARVEAGEPCALCGKPIDLDAPRYWIGEDGHRHFNPWALEVDEIVPVSKGGSPTDPNNVQPAHRRCNQRKGDGRKAKEHRRTQARGATSRKW